MFADYFDNKVQRIRASFPTTTADPMNADQLYYGPELCEFFPTTPTELSSLIRSIAKKSCSLDPIPGSLMTDCFSVLLPVFVNLINLSFKVLDPVIKKDSLDHEIYQNYRPISNLRFVSKATEKIVALRLTDHLEDNNLLKTFQSAYKKGHSTETALTRINADLLRAIYVAYSSHKLIDYNMYKIQLPACLQPPADMNTLLLYLETYIGCLCSPVLTLRYFLFLKY